MLKLLTIVEYLIFFQQFQPLYDQGLFMSHRYGNLCMTEEGASHATWASSVTDQLMSHTP